MLASFIVLTALLTMNDKRLTNDLSPYYVGTYCTFVVDLVFIEYINGEEYPSRRIPLPFTKGGSLVMLSIMLGLIFASEDF